MQQEPQQVRQGLTVDWAAQEVDHLLARFTRYTKFVLYSKWFLGVLALLLLGTLVVYPILVSKKPGVRVSFISADSASGKRGLLPSMNNPVYEGTNKTGQPYKVTGQRAIQVSPELIRVEWVEGQMLTSDSFVSLTADLAEYHQARNRIDLIGNVRLVHGGGYTFETPRASINTQTSEVRGDGRISGEGPMGNLLATGFEIRDNGDRIRFGGAGRVTVVIDRSQSAS